MHDWTTTYGSDATPTVVLLHPAGWTRHAWNPHADRLADTYRVVTVDLPGHGVHPDPTFTIERAVADLAAVLETVDGAVLVGHSLGGYVASRVAAAHGERIDGLVLAGAAYNWRTPLGLVLSGIQYVATYFYDAVARVPPLGQRFERTPTYESQIPPADEDVHPYLPAYASALRALTFRPSWPDIEAYDGPTLLVQATGEPLASHAGRLAVRARADLRWLPGDHYAPIDDPGTFTAVVAQFCAEVYGDTAIPVSTETAREGRGRGLRGPVRSMR